MIALRTVTAVLASIILLAACGQREDAPEIPAEAEVESSGGMENMPGMAGMEGVQGGMMEDMSTHMQMMHGASGDSIEAVLPMHRQVVANMIAQMNREMREMNMTTDAEWNATVEALRGDLTQMPEMSGSELQAIFPAHHDRVMRLMEMHREMMADMSM